ncbi:SET and MYND domain-containing protein 4-like isoform X1 [Diorhabda carinulata]|uniref:SET and MYND domain-containing protein 4-like isoform X1 n=1 Tax=Diorhabda carinulata TaxID=1163345 RepID=UPI0025A0018D|nr:SET and MYND domain-containing protein 4-like isoform X1 [Diorhabda carinulata]
MKDNNNSTIQGIFQDLIKNIQIDNEVKHVSDEFSKISSCSEKVSFVYALLKRYNLLPGLVVDEKRNEEAIKLREHGNQKFKEKKLKEALDLYTNSLAYAEKNSEHYPKAIANRSAVLFELELYEECIKDIETALDHNYPKELQLKIIKRNEIAKSKKTTNKKIHYFQQIPVIPKDSQSTSIQSASNILEIEISDVQGRYVVAKENIEIGDVLAVEKPFCHVLASEFFTHCHECLKLCYNLLPCPNCTQVLYCSIECQNNAKIYHVYECKILKTLRNLNLDKLKLLPLKIAISVKNSYSSISRINEESESFYRSDRYKEIHNLISNTQSRTVADLFERSTTAAIVFNLIHEHTKFFNSVLEESIFKELYLRHLQIAPCNFHEISELHQNQDDYFEAQEIGAGAFSFLSLFNHSCNPNVVRHCYGNVVVLRAIRSIHKGEQLFDNYGYHFALMPKDTRKTNLKKQYYFECNCYVCENNWPLLHNLPALKYDTGVTDADIVKLRKGDGTITTNIIGKLLPKFKQLESIQPNRLFFEMQEVLKQCYALSGNIRRK